MIPRGAIAIVTLCFITTSAHAQAAHAKTTTPRPPAVIDGGKIFAATCLACHQANGEGIEEKYPPLAGSEWAAGDEARVVRIALHGLTGPVEVAGQTYEGVMPGWGATLKDAEIAAVLTYVRAAWGNKAAPITVASVVSIRAATATRKTPWTVSELANVVHK
jgi:mono/diheme cytochrome c family protein